MSLALRTVGLGYECLADKVTSTSVWTGAFTGGSALAAIRPSRFVKILWPWVHCRHKQ